jgi:hypothetical protein
VAEASPPPSPSKAHASSLLRIFAPSRETQIQHPKLVLRLVLHSLCEEGSSTSEVGSKILPPIFHLLSPIFPTVDSKPPHGFSPFGHVAFAPVQTAYKPSAVLSKRPTSLKPFSPFNISPHRVAMKENSRVVLTHGNESKKPLCRVVTPKTHSSLTHQIERSLTIASPLGRRYYKSLLARSHLLSMSV